MMGIHCLVCGVEVSTDRFAGHLREHPKAELEAASVALRAQLVVLTEEDPVAWDNLRRKFGLET